MIILVTTRVERLGKAAAGQSVLVDSCGTVNQTAGSEERSGCTVSREPVQGDGFDALAAAHSRALAVVSSDIAAAIRATAPNR
jgi:hypothetical protein